MALTKLLLPALGMPTSATERNLAPGGDLNGRRGGKKLVGLALCDVEALAHALSGSEQSLDETLTGLWGLTEVLLREREERAGAVVVGRR